MARTATIPEKMSAAVWYGPKDLRIEERPVPEPGPGQILIEVARNGLCGSDLHTYLGSDTGGASMHVPGVVLGHEFAGHVRIAGDGVDDLRVGDAVAVAPIETCGSCRSCRGGHRNTCRRVALYGGYREPLDGGLARYVVVSRGAAHRVPERLAVEEAALAEPVAVAVHAVRRAPSLLGRSVLVLGGGPIGLAILQVARAAGAESTVVSEPSPARRRAAASLGAIVVDPDREALRERVRAHAREGVDVVFDTTAVHAAINQGIQAVAPHGTLVSVAGWQEPARLDMGIATAKELDLRFAFTYQPEADFPTALALLADRRVDPGVLISDHIPLDRLVPDGLEELLHHSDRHVKILVDPAPERIARERMGQ